MSKLLVFTKMAFNLFLAASQSLSPEKWYKILTGKYSEWDYSADLFFVQYYITATLSALVQN